MGGFGGRVALVTGASSGIGRATALALGQEGAQLVVAGRSERHLQQTSDLLTAMGVAVRSVAGDLREEQHIKDLIRVALDDFGRLDLLVNSAGVGYPGPILQGEREAWREMLEVNVLALCLTCREAVRAMSGRGGTIVNISALGGREPTPGFSVYCASKHAVDGFSSSLRLELGDSGIRILVVEPGQTMTNFARHIPYRELQSLAQQLGVAPEAVPNFEGEHAPEEFIQAVLGAHPDLFLSAEEIAQRILAEVLTPSPGLHRLTLRPEER